MYFFLHFRPSLFSTIQSDFISFFLISLSDSFFIMKTHYYFLYFHLYLQKSSLILLTCSKCAIYNSTIFFFNHFCVFFFFPNLFSLFSIHSSLLYSSVTFFKKKKTFRFYQTFIFSSRLKSELYLIQNH